ncbi:MAG: hypothetical protein LBJ21_04220, partial [Acidobacteriota bacterium]|nr:hypothetical protein [Acidobacteriota bacterium]
MPNRDTPSALVKAWLDIHNEDLCRRLDVVFAFDGQGMEIWCRSEENRAYRKLQKIIEPLRKSHDVELYLTRPPKNGNESDKLSWEDIPPSLVENRELRSNMRPSTLGSGSRAVTFMDADGNMQTRVFTETPGAVAATADSVLRSRLVIWVNSVFENSRIMRQYAEDIPALIRTAFEPAFSAALHGRARGIYRKHAKELVKSVRSLRNYLSRAFPGPSAKAAENKEKKKESPAALPVVIERADGIAADARNLSGRIYRFIYPAQHTVDLDELQRPGLLVSLDALEADA